MSHWLYNGKEIDEIPEGAFGFIYKIVNVQTGKTYIGRKNLKRRIKSKVKTKTKTAKSATKFKIKISDSDWKTYIGSNKVLIEEINDVGMQMFNFEILAFFFTQGQLNYAEENIQHYLNVTLSDKFYNDSIGSRRYINVVKDDRLLELISNLRNKF